MANIVVFRGKNPDIKLIEIKTDYGQSQNIKNAITGTLHSVSLKHVPRYLTEFEYRFNRRYRLCDMIERLTYVGLQTPPMPYRLLRLAEDHG
jgi:hypothetical protein